MTWTHMSHSANGVILDGASRAALESWIDREIGGRWLSSGRKPPEAKRRSTTPVERMETAVIANMTTVIDAAATERVGIPFGRYVLLERIASGGMGEIFLARQRGNTGLARLVAVKRILQHYTSDKNHVRMFFDEARLQSLLSDRHVVQIYDMGECDEHLYIAMEFVLGVSLRRLVQKVAESGLYLHPAHACDLAVQICRGLSYAHNVEDGQGHALSIVHRDVNPQNILVSYDGEVKIIDFGIAKSEMSDVKTETGTLKGKLTYMSPEQARGEKLDRRSDLFSTGICFYEMLTGKNPFERGNVILSLQAIESDDVPSIVNERRDCIGFDDILKRMLAKDADARFNDAAEIVEALVERYSTGDFGEPAMPLGDFMLRVFADEIQARLARLEGFGVKMAVRRRPVGDAARLAHSYALDAETSDPSRKRRASPHEPIPKTNPALLVSRVERTSEARSSTGMGEPVSISQSDLVSNEIYDSETAIAAVGSSQLPSSAVKPVVVRAALSPRAPDAPEKEPITEPTHSGAFSVDGLAPPPATSRRALAAGVAVGVTFGIAAIVLLAVMPEVDPTLFGELAAPPVSPVEDPIAHVASGATLRKADPDVPAPVVEPPVNAPAAVAAAPSENTPTTSDAPPDDADPEKAVTVETDPPDDEKHVVADATVSKPSGKGDRTGGGRSGARSTTSAATTTSSSTKTNSVATATATNANETAPNKTPTTTAKPVEKTVPVVVESGPRVKLAVRVGGGYTLEGRGVSGDSATLSVESGARRFKVVPPAGSGITVSVEATATDDGLQLSVTSEPWAIVRVGNIGRGRTPQRIDIARGDRAEIILKSPSGGEVTLVVKAS